jgi:hypothetical protein
MEAQPSVFRSDPWRGLGNGFHKQAVGDDSDPHTVQCSGDCSDASPVERGKGGRE